LKIEIYDPEEIKVKLKNYIYVKHQLHGLLMMPFTFQLKTNLPTRLYQQF